MSHTPAQNMKLGAVKPEPTPCAWCGLRQATCKVYATDTCNECRDGGGAFRVEMSLARFKRGRGEP